MGLLIGNAVWHFVTQIYNFYNVFSDGLINCDEYYYK